MAPPKRRLSPTVPPATISSSGSSEGFSANGEPDNPIDPKAFGIPGNQGVPATNGAPSAAAGKLLSRGAPKSPPPGADGIAPYVSAIAPVVPQPPPARPAQSPPPGSVDPAQIKTITDRMSARTPPKMIGDRPQDIDPATGKEKLGAKAASWAQRLGLAVLSATKLAPYANQIVRPHWSEEMSAYQGGQKQDESQLGALEKANNIASLEEQRAGTAEWRHAQAQKASDDAAEKIVQDQEKARHAQETERIKREDDFGKSLGKPEEYISGLAPDDPSIQNLKDQGWQVMDDIRHRVEPGQPMMKVAVPPVKMQITQDIIGMFPHRKIGDIIPYQEYKKAIDDEAKMQRENIQHPPARPQFNETELRIRAAGGTTGNAQIDQMSVPQAKQAMDIGRQQVNFNLSPEAKGMLADNVLAGGNLPSFGSRGGATVADIYNQAAAKKPGTDLAGAKQDYAANSGVIKDLEKTFARVKTSEGTAAKNLELAASISKRVDRSNSPILNKYILFTKGQIVGDDDTQLLDNVVETAANEYANVVSAGSSGGAAATVSARDHAREMLHASMANGTFQKVVAQMKQEMNNRRTSFEEGLKGARSNRPGAQSGNPEPQIPIKVQQSPSTKAYRYSTDGGATWHPGQPPK